MKGSIMEEALKLWNTKMTDLTVGDTVKVNLVLPIVGVVGAFIGTAAIGGLATLISSIRKPSATAESTE